MWADLVRSRPDQPQVIKGLLVQGVADALSCDAITHLVQWEVSVRVYLKVCSRESQPVWPGSGGATKPGPMAQSLPSVSSVFSFSPDC